MSSNPDPPGLMTLQRHIIKNQRNVSQATGEFSFLLSGITFAGKVLAHKVRMAGLANVLGETGTVNLHGERVQKLDEIANDLLLNVIGYRRSVRAVASEEVEDAMEIPETGQQGKYIILFDPLDGSSNIDVNIPVGTIFSILRRPDDASDWAGPASASAECLQQGLKQVAAGYVLYGSATVLVYTTGDGVHQFLLDPSIGAFVLVSERLKVPARKKIYSVNEANALSFPAEIRHYLDWVKTGEAGPYTARYVGSFVADFHRTLLKGGVFLYPATARAPNGKLRLMYEANPMAMLIEQAGGAATDGKVRILEKQPGELHERTPLIIGSSEEVDIVREFLSGKRGAVVA